mmetsp:Transcript_121414/g.211000  ORF Transcript_121414/g.211000 Transcript_121414/m.211000 type:complete len:113 (+) Transcript_121414:2009-2347(+)
MLQPQARDGRTTQRKGQRDNPSLWYSIKAIYRLLKGTLYPPPPSPSLYTDDWEQPCAIVPFPSHFLGASCVHPRQYHDVSESACNNMAKASHRFSTLKTVGTMVSALGSHFC